MCALLALQSALVHAIVTNRGHRLSSGGIIVEFWIAQPFIAQVAQPSIAQALPEEGPDLINNFMEDVQADATHVKQTSGLVLLAHPHLFIICL